MVRERQLIMLDELPRRTFFSALSALALSPLAWLGLRKEPEKTDLRVKRMYDTKEFYRKKSDLDNYIHADTVKYHVGREKYWRERALVAEKALKVAQAKIDRSQAEDAGFSYEPVPLEEVGTIQVRYKDAQPLKPLFWQYTT